MIACNRPAPARTTAGTSRRTTIRPAVSLLETAGGFLLRAEMPGVPQEGVEVTVHEHLLTLVGHRPKTPRSGVTLHRESNSGDYHRTFALDPAIDASRIRARIDQGLLTVELPKAEAARPQIISVGG